MFDSLLAFVMVAVFGISGGLEYLKGWWKEAPGYVWRLALLAASFGLGFARGGNLGDRLLTGLLILAASQVAYQVILQAFTKAFERIGALLAGGGGAPAQAPEPPKKTP